MKHEWIPRLLGTLVAGTVLSAPGAGAHTPHHDIYELAVSPRFFEDQTLFVIARGNLLRSSDGGRQWKRLVRGLDHEHVPAALAIASGDPRVLYLGTLGDGVFRSTDAGSSWSRTSRVPGGGSISELAVSPGTADRVLAIGEAGGLYLSADAGTSWTRVIEEARRLTSVAFGARGTWAAAGDDSGALLVSRDRGRSWTLLASLPGAEVSALAFEPIPEGGIWVAGGKGQVARVDLATGAVDTVPVALGGEPVTAIAISPDFANDGSVWLSTWRGGVIYSEDRGASWRRCAAGLTTHPQAERFARPDFGKIEVSTTHAQDRTVFVGGFDGLFVSGQGSCRWEAVPVLSTVTITGLGISPAYARDRTVAVGTYLWGAYLSRDGGRTWEPSRSGMAEGRSNGIARTFDVVFSPDYPRDRTLFSNTWWLLLRSLDGGRHWEQLNPGGGGYSLGVSPAFARDRTLYMATMLGRILRSTNGGEELVEVGRVSDPVGALVISPAYERDRTLFLGATGAVYRSRDAGSSWERADTGIVFPQPRPGHDPPRWERELEDQRAGVHLALSPAFEADGSLFAGTARGLFRSVDRGDRWKRVFPQSSDQTGIVEAVAVSPAFAQDGTVLLSVRGRGLFRSEDRGRTFHELARELIESNVQLANPFGFPLAESPAIEFSPDYQQDGTVFAFAEATVFRSRDRGASWQPARLTEPTYDALTVLRLRLLVLCHSRAATAVAVLSAAGIVLTVLGRVRAAATPVARAGWVLLLVAGSATVAILLSRIAP